MSIHSASGVEPPGRRGAIRSWLPGLILVAAAFAVYLPLWRAGFIWDDDAFLVDNPLVHARDGLYRLWFTTAAPDYFPMTSTTLWLEWRLWGAHPLGYHIVNVCLHAASALLIWRVMLRLIPQFRTGAWLTAALFAVHPVNVQSVAWITERKNTLAMCFLAGTVLSYLEFEDSGRRRWYWIGLGTFALGLLSKTAVAPLPMAIMGLAWWRRGKVRLKDVVRLAPFFALAALVGLIAMWFQYHRAIGHEAVHPESFASRLAGAGWAAWFYLGKALLPLNLIFIYPRWRISGADPLAYAPDALLLGTFLLCWRYRKGWGKPMLLGMGYFVLMLLPVLGFLDIYFMRYSLVADHWQYFAIVGPIGLISAAMAKGLIGGAQREPMAGRAICGTVLVIFGLLTWRQCGMYADVETLWLKTVASNPESDLAQYNLGDSLHRQGRIDEAAIYYERALRIKPDFPQAHNNLGNILLQKGRTAEAIAEYRKALENETGYAQAYNNLANALLQAGQPNAAIACFKKASELQPGAGEPLYNLANVLRQRGRFREALTNYQKSIELQPNDVNARNNMAWLLATCPDATIRDGAKALELARQAERLSGGKDPIIEGTLAAALAETGRYAEAIGVLHRALEIAGAQGEQGVADALNAHLRAYQAGAAYRDDGAIGESKEGKE